MKARLPFYSEVYNFDGTNLWMHNYLASQFIMTTSPVTGEGLQNINTVYGYWTLSSYSKDTYGANIIYFNGKINVTDVNINGYCGVRPVITVPISEVSQ